MGGCLSRGTGGFEPSKDLQDLTGKVVIVTGGNTGIGFYTTKHLALLGAKVYLGARTPEKGLAAIQRLEDEEGVPTGRVEYLQVDFGDPRGARRAAEEFGRREERLDVLGLRGLFELTKDGISQVMVTNHFGPFIFTRLLLPMLIKTSQMPGADVRIVTLSSEVHKRTRAAVPDIQFRDIEDFNGEFASDTYPDLSRYCVTKLANMLMAIELQRLLDAHSIPILSIAIHPGEVSTFADRLPYPLFWTLVMAIFFMLPEQGAYNSLFAAAAPRVREEEGRWGGRFLMPVGRIEEASPNARRRDLARDLWETSERVVEGLGIELPKIDKVA